eukprot:UN02554
MIKEVDTDIQGLYEFQLFSPSIFNKSILLKCINNWRHLFKMEPLKIDHPYSTDEIKTLLRQVIKLQVKSRNNNEFISDTSSAEIVSIVWGRIL